MKVILRDSDRELSVADVKYAVATEYPENLLFNINQGADHVTGVYFELGSAQDGDSDQAFAPCEYARAKNIVLELFDTDKVDISDLVCMVCPDRDEYFKVVGGRGRRIVGFDNAIR